MSPLFDGSYVTVAFLLIASGGLGWLALPGRKGLLFLIYNLCLGHHYFYHGIHYSGLIQNIPWYTGAGFLTCFWGGPYFYFFFRNLFLGDTKIRRRDLLHLLLPAIVACLTLVAMLRHPETMLQYHAHSPPLPPEYWPYRWLQPLFGAQLLLYGILVVRMALQKVDFSFVLSTVRAGRFPLQFQMLILSLHVMLLGSALGFFLTPGVYVLYRIFPLMMALSLLSVYVLGLVFPYAAQLGILVEVGPAFSVRRYTKSRLKNVNLHGLENSLFELMSRQKLFRDENLTIGTLAASLELHSLQLSEYLNVIKEKSFHEFIRFWRIKEAMRLIREESPFNMTRIAYESGFNSQSAFYKAFRAETGMTPGEFQGRGKRE